jgi:hypothetical protein
MGIAKWPVTPFTNTKPNAMTIKVSMYVSETPMSLLVKTCAPSLRHWRVFEAHVLKIWFRLIGWHHYNYKNTH